MDSGETHNHAFASCRRKTSASCLSPLHTHARTPVVNLAHAPAKHDGLDPLPALAVGQALAEGATVARDEGLTELVAIVAGAVGGIDEDLERRGEVRWGMVGNWFKMNQLSLQTD